MTQHFGLVEYMGENLSKIQHNKRIFSVVKFYKINILCLLCEG